LRKISPGTGLISKVRCNGSFGMSKCGFKFGINMTDYANMERFG
jgi:hypothetical protein